MTNPDGWWRKKPTSPADAVLHFDRARATAQLEQLTIAEQQLQARQGTDLLVADEHGSDWLAVTAPHAVIHRRDATPKLPELGTGGLAHLLAATGGGLSLAAAGQQTGDANWDPTHPLKTELLRRAPRAVLDLHGMRDTHGPDLCLGTGAHPERAWPLVRIVHHHATAAGLRVSVDWPFNARQTIHVTSAAQAGGADAVQIELALRCLRGGDHTLAAVHALTQAVNELRSSYRA